MESPEAEPRCPRRELKKTNSGPKATAFFSRGGASQKLRREKRWPEMAKCQSKPGGGASADF